MNDKPQETAERLRRIRPNEPQTEEDRAEAFRLLDELQKESARQDALREVLARALDGRAGRQ